MEKVSVSWFLGVHITADLTGGVNTAEVVNKAQQRLHFLSVITKTKTQQHPPQTAGILISLLNRKITDVSSLCVVFQLHSGTKHFSRLSELPREKSACPLWRNFTIPTVSGKAPNFVWPITHISSSFKLLPSGRQYRTIKSRANRLKVSTPQPLKD